MKLRLLLTIVLLFFLAKSFSQQRTIEKQDSLLNEANHHLLLGDYDQAIVQYKELLKAKEIKNEALLYNQLAHSFYKKLDREEAKNYAEKALKTSQVSVPKDTLQEAIAWENLARFEQPEKALEYYAKALGIKKTMANIDSAEVAISLYHVSRMIQIGSEYETARSYLNRVVNMNLEPTPRNHMILSNIYHVLGRVHYDQGLKDAALKYYFKGLEYALKEVPNDHGFLDQLNNEIGITYMDKGYNYEALKYYEKALSLNMKRYSHKINPDQVAIHFNMGMTYANLGRKDKALFHTQKTLELGKTAFGENNPIFHFPYSQLGRLYGKEKRISYLKKAIGLLERKTNDRKQLMISGYHIFIADIYTQMKAYKKAQVYLKKALDIRLRISGKNNFRTIESQNKLAQNFLLLKDPAQALIEVNISLKSNYIDLESVSEINGNFDISKVIDPHLFIEAIEIRIDILMKQYQSNQDGQLLKMSYQLASGLDDVIVKTRNALRDSEDKLQFTSLVKKIYEKQVAICLRLHELESDETYKTAAFEFSEKSKSNVLRELVNSPKIKDEIIVDDEIISLEKEINERLARVRSQLVVEVAKPISDSIKVYAFQEEIVHLFHRKDSLEKSIELAYPKYYQLKYDKPVLSVLDVQSQLEDNTTFIEFLMSEDLVFSFVINKDSYHVQKVQIDSLDQRIQDFNMSIVNQDRESYEKSAGLLYRDLFAPIEGDIEGQNVIVVPDETLWHLQFDLLLKGENSSKNKYLVYDYAFTYANSATFLNETKRTSIDRNVNSECLAFSFSSEEMSTEGFEVLDLERLRNSTVGLPGTREEIKAVSKIFDGSYYYGKSANEHNFKSNVSSYKIAHLALHAEVDSLQPENLKILFSNVDQTTQNEDNILYSHELYALKIPSDLVVLSACNTGVGKINNGEGILSIGNAFQYAGAKSLLLSRWKISDETTPLIMEQFYENLKSGMSKGQALQQAKVHYLDNSSQLQSAPYYWGSFYILGDESSIEMNSTPNYFLIVTILLVILLVLYILRKRRNAA